MFYGGVKMRKIEQSTKELGTRANQEGVMKIHKVVEFRSCLTCVYRKPYPATTGAGQPVFFRFLCGLSMDSLKELVRPEEVCDFWKGVILGIDYSSLISK